VNEVHGKGQPDAPGASHRRADRRTCLLPAHARLAPSPYQGENRTLLLPLIGHKKPLARSSIHLIVKEIFALAAARLRLRGLEWHA
jgi:hypothetical protein